MKLPNIKLKIGRMTVEKVWLAELILACVILAFLLAFDVWIYKTFVRERKPVETNNYKSAIIKKIELEKIAKKIKDQNSFIENPVLPVVKNPF